MNRRKATRIITGQPATDEAGVQLSRFLLIAGTPLGEPVVRGGPLVMNTREELTQAFADYQSGNF